MRRWIAALAGTALWLALAAAAFAWPPAWQPGDKAFMVEDIHQLVVSGEVLTVEVRLYDDGARVLLVNGRPYGVDPLPGVECAPFWHDEGMLSVEPKHEIPPSEWRAPDWHLVKSQHPDCKEA